MISRGFRTQVRAGRLDAVP